MSNDRPKLREDQRYEALVSAASAEEAAEIAAEALQPELRIIQTDVVDVSDVEGKDSFRVTLWYEGGKRGHGMEGN